MLGTGESPMLRNGYAKYVLDVCWLKPMFEARAFWSEFCPIVGKDVPSMPLELSGNAMFALCRSLAD